MDILQRIAETLIQIKQKKPLVHQITNFVTANDCANITLAIGASPVMANDIGEVEDMVSYASALVLNIGTLNARSVEAMLVAGKKANEFGIPVILDPVGAGATRLRTATAERIVRAIRLAAIRGNMSEIKVLAGLNAGIKGVDSTADEQDGETVAIGLSKRLDCVVAITGPTDVIARGDDVCRIHNGHALLAGVTGTGCMATALVGCCLGAVDDAYIGTAAGVAFMGIAGEVAERLLKPEEGLGMFRMHLFDAVSQMTSDWVLKYGKIS